jgi:diguanylate cyclase (GGDEF)-like protein
MRQDSNSSPPSDPQEKSLRYAVLRLATLLREIKPKLGPTLESIRDMARGELDSQELARQVQSLGQSLGQNPEANGQSSFARPPKEQEPALSLQGEQQELHALLDKLLLHLPRPESRQKLQNKLGQTQATDLKTLNRILYAAINELDTEDEPQQISRSLLSFVQEFLQHLQSIKTLGKKISLFEKELYTMPPARAKQWARDFANSIYNEIARLNRHHNDLRELVTNIGTQLALFEQHIQESAGDDSERRQDQERLQIAVDTDVDSLQAELKDLQPPQELQQMVQQKLANIQKQLTDYRKREQERLHRAENRVQELNHTINQLQLETQKLQKQNQQKTELLHKDTLTRVNNRFAYEQYLRQHFNQWQKDKRSLHFCVWDIDHFKHINDTHGHKVGDQVLKKTALLIQGELSQSEFFARIGGEEFVLFVFDQKDSDIQRFMEQIRRKIDDSRLTISDKTLHVTISGGVARLRPEDSPDALYSRADKALYRSKSEGRNRVSLAWQDAP